MRGGTPADQVASKTDGRSSDPVEERLGRFLARASGVAAALGVASLGLAYVAAQAGIAGEGMATPETREVDRAVGQPATIIEVVSPVNPANVDVDTDTNAAVVVEPGPSTVSPPQPAGGVIITPEPSAPPVPSVQPPSSAPPVHPPRATTPVASPVPTAPKPHPAPDPVVTPKPEPTATRVPSPDHGDERLHRADAQAGWEQTLRQVVEQWTSHHRSGAQGERDKRWDRTKRGGSADRWDGGSTWHDAKRDSRKQDGHPRDDHKGHHDTSGGHK